MFVITSFVTKQSDGAIVKDLAFQSGNEEFEYSYFHPTYYLSSYGNING
jgi:hypothetical protein